MSRLAITAALGAVTVSLAGAAVAGPVQVTWTEPTLDQWIYPFNPTPGSRNVGSTFGELIPDGLFDNRDGQVLFGFDSSADVTPGLGASSYTVVSATMTVLNENDLVFVYDDTPDPYTAYLDPADPEYTPDTDPGQAMELFGTGFRNGFTPATFVEGSPYCDACSPTSNRVRNAYALGYDGGAPVDVSNSVEERWSPTPFAVGLTALDPGDFVPANTLITFELDVANPDVQAYLQNALDGGMVDMVLTSLTQAVPMGGDFPTFYLKENPLVEDEIVSAAQLTIEVLVEGVPCAADITGPDGAGNPDGNVDALDFLLLIAQWGSPCTGSCEADITGPAAQPDGNVDALDFLLLIAQWGTPGNCL